MNKHGSLDVTFSYTPVDGRTLLLETDIEGIPAYQTEELGYEDVDVRIGSKTSGGSHFIIVGTEIDGAVVDQSDFELDDAAVSTLNVRIYLHDSYISVYCNNVWVYSYTMAYARYNLDPVASISAHGGALTLTNVIRSEIHDAREAIYVDYEATTESAIQSVIQQRPINTFPEVDRIIAHTYRHTKDEVAAHHVFEYAERVSSNSQLSSDGLVYYEDVGISISEQTAEEVGFITRMYRMSELETGAVEAASVAQVEALQARKSKAIRARLDPRLQPRDVLDIALTASGTETSITDEVVVDDISISMQDGDYKMSITGRRNI